MASRFDHSYSSRPGYYDSGYSHPTGGSYPYRSHSRAQSEHTSQNNYSRSHGYDYRGKPRSNTLSAFVEDEPAALAREHNPGKNHGPTTAASYIQSPGEIDQVPILIEVEVEENPERRFVFIPGAAEAPSETSTKSSGSGSRTPKASSTQQEASANIPDNWTASSVNESILSDATPRSSLSTPPSSADGVTSEHVRSSDTASGYEANTCRKFVVVPRTDTESVVSEPSTISSDTDHPNDHRRRTPQPADSDSNSRAGKDAGMLGAAAAAASAAALAGAALRGFPKNEPEIKRRKSRVDLPRLDTDIDQQPIRNTPSSSGRPTTASQSDRRPHDRATSDRGSRSQAGDKTDRRDNDFLSPAFTKHSTTGRDRPYFDQSTASASATTGPSQRTRSRDAHSSLDDGRSHGHGRASFSADPDSRRRANSFSDNDKSKTSTYKRPSRDETASSRNGRRSPSPRAKSPSPPSPHPRSERRLPSPPGARDRDWERERERERDRADRERQREREREEERQRERRRVDKDLDRDSEKEREKERIRCGVDADHTDRDRQRPARQDSVHRKRRDSIAREDDVYSSDERSKLGATANTPIRRRNSERRRPGFADVESVVSKASSNPDPSRMPAGSDASANGRLKPSGTTVLATPKSSQTQLPIMSGSPPKALFEPRPSSPTKSYREERPAKDGRRAESPSSPSSSPESRSRIPEGDRPRGPRPRAHTPNVVHNPTSATSSLPNLSHPAAQPRTSSFPVPISVPVPISMPSRTSVSMREDGEGRRERRRSPVDTSRGYSSFSGNPARASGVFVPLSTSQTPTSRQPAFYINVPGSAVSDTDHSHDHDRALDRAPEVPFKGSDSGRTDQPLVPIYQQYAEDVYHGRIQGLADCPRQSFSTRYRDWRTLAPFDDFYVCPKCYDSAFRDTRYADDFVPAPPPLDPNEKTRCTFGSMYWYRVAFFFIESYKKPNLNLLRAMFSKDETLRLPCSGPNRVMGRWFTIQDPITARAITRFSTCEQCATAIQILFPRLKGLFQDNDPSRYDTTNICALYFEPDRKRLWKYIDVFETTHNEAVSVNRPVDVNDFVNRLLDIGYYDECRRDIPVRGRKWYWMRSVPNFVVCQECFQEAVFPQVNNYRAVAGDFFKEPKDLPLGACHLYSPRMRDIFVRACKNSDKKYLVDKLRERDEIATDITNRIHSLPPTITHESVEHKLLIAEWRKWE